MKTLILATAIALCVPSVAQAQDAAAIEPYVGLLGGPHSFDGDSELGSSATYGSANGALGSLVAGINLPIGPGFAGIEGNATKGLADINWEYGAKVRVGARTGGTGLIYVSAGYQWVDGKARRGFADGKDWMYGFGLEAGADRKATPRLRFQVDTFDFDSLRPMMGVIFPM